MMPNRLSLMNLSIVLMIFILFTACSSSRQITKEEILKFNSIIALYEAKYKDKGRNSWWPVEYPDYRAVIFNVATNEANIKWVKEGFIETTQLYCVSHGWNFSYKEAFDRPVLSYSYKQYNDGLNSVIDKRKARPDFVCLKDNAVIFKGVIVAGEYHVQSTGGYGADLRVWAEEYKK